MSKTWWPRRGRCEIPWGAIPEPEKEHNLGIHMHLYSHTCGANVENVMPTKGALRDTVGSHPWTRRATRLRHTCASTLSYICVFVYEYRYIYYSLSPSRSRSFSFSLHMYICLSVYLSLYMYIYICRKRDHHKRGVARYCRQPSLHQKKSITQSYMCIYIYRYVARMSKHVTTTKGTLRDTMGSHLRSRRATRLGHTCASTFSYICVFVYEYRYIYCSLSLSLSLSLSFSLNICISVYLCICLFLSIYT